MRNPFWITQYGHQPWVLVGIICIYMWYDARIQLPRSILIWLEFWNALTHLVATLYELGAPQGFVCWAFLAANLFNELEDRLESVHAEAQAPLQWEDAGSTVQRSLWQVRCMGSWYLVGVSRRSQYAFAKSLESLTSMRHVFIPSVPNEGLFKVSLKNWLFQASPQKGSVSAFGCFKWLCGTVKFWGKEKCPIVSHEQFWSVLHFLRSWKSMWSPRYSNTETTDLWAVLWHQTWVLHWSWKQHVRHANGALIGILTMVRVYYLLNWIHGLKTIVQRRLLSSSHTNCPWIFF